MSDNKRHKQNADWVRELAGNYVEGWVGDVVADHIEELHKEYEANMTQLKEERDEARKLVERIADAVSEHVVHDPDPERIEEELCKVLNLDPERMFEEGDDYGWSLPWENKHV